MTLLSEDLERLERKHERQRAHGGGASTRTRKLRAIQETAEQLGRSASAREVAKHDPLGLDIEKDRYRVEDSWDETLRAAGLQAHVDIVSDWLTANITDPERETPFVFRSRDVTAATGLSGWVVGQTLANLRDGQAAVVPDPPLVGEIVVTRRPVNGIVWGCSP